MVENAKKPPIKKYLPLFFVLAMLIVVIILIYVSLDQKNKCFTNTAKIFETQVSQTLCGDDAEKAAALAKEKISNLEDKISYKIEGSDIERLNNAAGDQWVELSEETIEILGKLIGVSKISSGVIDPTVLPLMLLWNFNGEQVYNPAADEIKNLLPYVDYNNIKINHGVNRVKIENKMTQITFDAVKKGAACKAAIDVYKDSKIDYGIVCVGETVGLYGSKHDGSPWKISIKNPFNDQDKNIAAIKVKDGFVSTFGAKEDKIKVDGKIYNKVLNAKTGYPAENGMVCVTVLHSDPIIADALAQLCCILGKDESQDILSHYSAEAVFVDKEKNIYGTKNIELNITVMDETYMLKSMGM